MKSDFVTNCEKMAADLAAEYKAGSGLMGLFVIVRGDSIEVASRTLGSPDALADAMAQGMQNNEKFRDLISRTWERFQIRKREREN